jgi:hypothetical protein
VAPTRFKRQKSQVRARRTKMACTCDNAPCPRSQVGPFQGAVMAAARAAMWHGSRQKQRGLRILQASRQQTRHFRLAHCQDEPGPVFQPEPVAAANRLFAAALISRSSDAIGYCRHAPMPTRISSMCVLAICNSPNGHLPTRGMHASASPRVAACSCSPGRLAAVRRGPTADRGAKSSNGTTCPCCYPREKMGTSM